MFRQPSSSTQRLSFDTILIWNGIGVAQSSKNVLRPTVKGAFVQCWFGEVDRRPFSRYLEFRKADNKLLSEGGTEIKFCPWCGFNLRERYAPGRLDTEIGNQGG